MKILNVKNFGIIQSAKIKLNGLTVIAGENNSGKSTVGKLLFSIIKAIKAIDKSTEDKKENDISLKIKELYSLVSKDNKTNIEKTINFFEPSSLKNELEKYIKNTLLIDIEKKYFEAIFSKRKKLLKENNLFNTFTESLLDEIKKLVEAEANDDELLTNHLHNIFHSEFYSQISPKNKNLETLIEYKEEDELLTVNIKNNKINSLKYYTEPPFFEDATLIENPLLLQISNLILKTDLIGENSTRPKTHFHLKDLVEKIKNAENFISNNASIPQEFLLSEINKIISGEFYFDTNKQTFYYETEKNGRIEAINTATGIKSFGLFQLLIKSKDIHPKNIIIIDEPENHLHPEWQLKYAKMIVELVKNGISVLVSSHSIYMIQALKRYSEKENIKDKVSFYHAEIEKDGHFANIREKTDDLNVIFSKLAKPIKEIVWE